MMKVVHKTDGGPPVEIARKNWEDQREKKASDWDIVHEGNPVLLLKKKQGSDEFEEDQLYDLELTPMIIGRHPDDYKVIDYQKAKLKKPVVPVDPKKLGDKYIKKFHPEKIAKPKAQAPNPGEFVARQIFNQPNKNNRTQDEIDAEELDLNTIDAASSGMPVIEDFEQIGAIKDDLGKVIVYLTAAVVLMFSFIGGYYFRDMGEMPTQLMGSFIGIVTMAFFFAAGFFLRNIIHRFGKKN